MGFFLRVVLAHRNIFCHTKSASCLVDLRFWRTGFILCAETPVLLSSGGFGCSHPPCRELAWKLWSVCYFLQGHFSISSCFPAMLYPFSDTHCSSCLWNKVSLLFLWCFTFIEPHRGTFTTILSHLAEPELCMVYSVASFVPNSFSWLISIDYLLYQLSSRVKSIGGSIQPKSQCRGHRWRIVSLGSPWSRLTVESLSQKERNHWY